MNAESPVDLAGLFHARVEWWVGGDAMEKGHGNWWTLAGFGVLTLLGPYVGAYYALVGPSYPLYRQRMWMDPGYFSTDPAQSIAEVIFWPIHKIDCQLRPNVWYLDGPDNGAALF
jgi:hypothetical protein